MLASILAGLLSLSHPQASPACEPISGWEELMDERNARYLVVGEVHGTTEMPAIFADVVCLEAMDAPVAVALEVPDLDQPLIDVFLASDGGPEARADLLQSLWFQNEFKDGRSSTAMLDLMEALRQMYQAGAVTGVTAFQPVGGRSEMSSATYEQMLAEFAMGASTDDERVLILVGNTHARTAAVTFGDRTYLPMAATMPREETLSLIIRENGGESWNCTGNPVTCGVSGWSGPETPFARRVTLSDDPQFPWDAMLYLGRPTTASLPAE